MPNETEKKLRLNLGSHSKVVKGYLNVDALDLPNVDVKHDLTKFPYPFDTNSVYEILAQEVLEHISFRYTMAVLREWYRILRPGGKVLIQVPDIEAMCRMIDLQCECVPRKALKYEDYKADPECFNCNGKALIHPERWKYAFSGAQKHQFDSHLNHFTWNELSGQLAEVGFQNIKRISNIYKLIMEAEK